MIPTELPYEFGVTRLFGDCDMGTVGLVSGWSVPETAHAWNDGLEAVLRIGTQKPPAASVVTFEGEPFLGGRCTQQDIVLYMNGFRLGFWRLTEAHTHTLSAEIEFEQFFVRKSGAVAKFSWHLPMSGRPSDLGLGTDARQLGFCFRSFTITSK